MEVVSGGGGGGPTHVKILSYVTVWSGHFWALCHEHNPPLSLSDHNRTSAPGWGPHLYQNSLE